ncbi:peptidoglycan-binding protein [Archangium violaceum]|uniref:peptidoglycan-binding protein n=1 Tax=Archangium violaceum TaxID=83451 RepID=UPI0036DE0F76
MLPKSDPHDPAVSASRPAARAAPPTLRRGAKGPSVVTLQKKLAAAGFSPGAADGEFGDRTLSAVKDFQHAKGLTPDGEVGSKTWGALGRKVGGRPSSGGGHSVSGYVKGVPRRITVSSVPNGKDLRSDAAVAYNRMYAAARSGGITLKVNSGFRTMSEQQALYKAYKNGTGNLAARPGFSNHQGGIAVDVDVGGTGTSTYKWMAAHAKSFGFVRTEPSEPWHWEFKP